MTNQRTVHLNAFETTLAGSMTDTATSMTVVEAGSLAAPCWLVIDKDDPVRREYVFVSAVAGTTLTVTRYQSGSAALSGITHSAGASVVLTPTRQSFDDLHDRIEAHTHTGTGTPNTGAKLDHGAALNGLADDDHPQYLLASGSRAMAGALNMGGNNITNPGTVGGLTLADLMPVGSVIMTGQAAAPSGWLLCDGAAVSRTTYAALFAAIGTAYGAGDGSTTFNLPNVQQRFPLGKAPSGTGGTLGETGGAIDHTHTQPTHTHTGPSHTHTGPSHSHGAGTLVANANFDVDTNVAKDGAANVQQDGHGHSISGSTATGGTGNTGSGGTGNTGSGGGDDTGASNPPFVTFNFIIKT